MVRTREKTDLIRCRFQTPAAHTRRSRTTRAVDSISGDLPLCPRLAQPDHVRTYPVGVTAVTPEGRKLLRVEARNAATPIERKPPWIKTRLKMGPQYRELTQLVRSEGLHTVCQEAGCPNIYECWEDREATFLIGGDQCTRRCDFCQIDTGKPAAYDPDEPRRVAESVATMGLKYATITGVARDDLPDGGAWLYAETVRQIHTSVPDCGVELLMTAPADATRTSTLWAVFLNGEPKGQRTTAVHAATELRQSGATRHRRCPTPRGRPPRSDRKLPSPPPGPPTAEQSGQDKRHSDPRRHRTATLILDEPRLKRGSGKNPNVTARKRGKSSSVVDPLSGSMPRRTPRPNGRPEPEQQRKREQHNGNKPPQPPALHHHPPPLNLVPCPTCSRPPWGYAPPTPTRPGSP